MKLEGDRLIPLPQQEVWERFNDAATLQASIPGCESLTQVTPDTFELLMVAAIGPVKAKFKGKLVLTDVNAPDSYRLNFDGSGGAAGFGKGTARVMLAAEGDLTRLRYEVSVQVGGKIAQVGSRLIQGVSEKLSEEFFTRFVSLLQAKPVAVTDASSGAAGTPELHGSSASAPIAAALPMTAASTAQPTHEFVIFWRTQSGWAVAAIAVVVLAGLIFIAV